MADKKRILVVDDEEQIVNLVKFKLEKSGYDVVGAENGMDALEKIREQKPDLVILDVMMPIMDGFEVLRRMKADPETEDVPTIMLTARSMEEDVLKGFDTGAVDYITKPFSVSELAARVRTNLGLVK